MKKQQAILLLIILAAIALRLTGVDDYSLINSKYKEGTAAYDAYLITQGQHPFKDYLYSHTPLALYAIAALFKTMGATLKTARIAMAIASSIIMIPSAYLIGKKLYSENTGLIMAIAFAASPVYIEYAATAVPDSLMASLGLLSTALLLRHIETGEWKMLLASSAALSASILTKETGVFFAAANLLAIQMYGKEAGLMKKHIGLALAPLIAFFAVILATSLPKLEEYALLWSTHSLSLPLGTRISMGIGSMAADKMLFPFIIAAFAGLLYNTRKADRFAIAWAGIALLHFAYRNFGYQYLLLMLPPIYLLLGGFVNRFEKRKGYAFVLMLLAMGATVNLAAVLAKNSEFRENTELTSISYYVKENTPEGGKILSPELQIALMSQRKHPESLFEFSYTTISNGMVNQENAIGTIEKEEIVAIIATDRVKELPGLIKYLDANYRVAAIFNTTQGEVPVYFIK